MVPKLFLSLLPRRDNHLSSQTSYQLDSLAFVESSLFLASFISALGLALVEARKYEVSIKAGNRYKRIALSKGKDREQS